MTNNKTPVRLALGLEELAVVLNLMGYPEVAKGALFGQLGEINVDEERGRLLAANNSLLARDLLYLQGDQIRMKSEYAQLLGFLVTNDFAVRGTVRRKGTAEEHLTYYMRDGRAVEHHITHVAVHAFRKVTQVEANEALLASLVPAGATPFESTSFTIDERQLDQAGSLTRNEGEASAIAFLCGLNVPEDASVLLADDLRRQNFRSAAMRVRMNMSEGLDADQGYLVLGGESGRAWHMDIHARNGDARLVVQPATARLMRQSTKALFRTP